MLFFRIPAPDGSVDSQTGKVITVLPDDAVLKNKYYVKYLTTGGMGVVYLAHSAERDRKYIIKEVDSSYPKLVMALAQEKATLERLDHIGIVKLYDFFEEEGYYYLVLEHIAGKTLKELIPPFPDVFLSEKTVIEWAIQILEVFDYLHNLNPPIIYRDLKPDNVMLTKDGKIKLIDFGIARVYKKGKATDTEYFGSVITASPEHYGGAQTDVRSDIYTIGATIHYLLTSGRAELEEPFKFPKIRSINPNVSPQLEEILEKALSLDPDERYQTAKEFKLALEKLLPKSTKEVEGGVTPLEKKPISIKSPIEKQVQIMPKIEKKKSFSSSFIIVFSLFLLTLAFAFYQKTLDYRRSIVVFPTQQSISHHLTIPLKITPSVAAFTPALKPKTTKPISQFTPTVYVAETQAPLFTPTKLEPSLTSKPVKEITPIPTIIKKGVIQIYAPSDYTVTLRGKNMYRSFSGSAKLEVPEGIYELIVDTPISRKRINVEVKRGKPAEVDFR